jgi:ubiquinone/menaquinone biosynthesis C-methylase UbiE
MPSTQDRIEILSVDLLEQQRPIVESLKRMARSCGLEFGWHYLLDLTWTVSNLGIVVGTDAKAPSSQAGKGRRILDAGAGTGVLQWYLADRGAEVISVDRMSRASLPLRFRRRFNVRGMRKSSPPDLESVNASARTIVSGSVKNPRKFLGQARDLLITLSRRRSPGCVIIYNQDLNYLNDIPDNSVDSVVAISALEHNTPEGLQNVVTELMRVLKPGGALIATLCASAGEDWFHKPSAGWCYSEASLRRLFQLSADASSNYERYGEYFERLKNNTELRKNLASFYYQSGDNGMPWGKWDPQYQPVGVYKTKGVNPDQ